MRPVACGVILHLNFGAEDLTDPLLPQHFARRTVNSHAPLVKQYETVEVERRQVQVVHRRQHGEPSLPVESLYQLEDLHLVADVEMNDRFVEQ